MSIKRIGVLTSGGDSPGMNPCVRAVVRTALYHGIEVYGIRRGWNGLISGDIIKLDEKSVSHTINRGGTILYTARSLEFMTEEGQRKAVSTCKFLGLDGIVAIGGDGTFRGARALSRYGINDQFFIYSSFFGWRLTVQIIDHVSRISLCFPTDTVALGIAVGLFQYNYTG